MEFRDYYKVLGVERSATADQVKAAYRRLARKYHPDVSKEKDAEARFKEMQEAYEVLKDPQKRAAYDELGSDWKSGQQFRPPPGWDGAAAGHARRTRSRGTAGRGSAAGPAGDAGFTDEQFSDFFSSLFGGRSASRRRRPARPCRAATSTRAWSLILRKPFAVRRARSSCDNPQLKADGSVELRSRTVRVNIPAG